MKLGYKWHLTISKNIKNKSPVQELFAHTDFKIIECKEGVFQADPFLFTYGGEHFIFYEECDYKKGIIKCSRVDMDSLEIKDTYVSLEGDNHISFPNIFKNDLDDNVYMIPETSKSGSIIILKLRQFPNDWEVINEIRLPGRDTSVLNYNNMNYLLTSLGNNNNMTLIEMSSFSDKPRVVFSKDYHEFRTKRNAGRIFKTEAGLVRPVQFDLNDYGENIHFNKIEIKKDENRKIEVVEEVLKKYNCIDTTKGIAGIHHFDFNDDLIVSDINLKINYDQSRYW